MQKQLDMNVLIKHFFDSAEKYIQKMRGLYTDKVDLAQFDKEMLKFVELRKVAESLPNITNWNDRYRMSQKLSSIFCEPMLFMKPNSRDNSTYFAFVDLVRALADYYQTSAGVNDKFLASYKKWCYKISDNRLKDFIYPFVSASYIAKRSQKDISK